MSRAVHVPWDERLVRYDFGPGHPLAPVRVELTMALALGLGVLDRPVLTLAPVEPAGDDLLTLVHEPAYLAAVRRAGTPPLTADLAHGLGTPDDPLFEGMHDAGALICGASVAAARAVWSGEADHGVNVAGGLHHAMASAASGFCIYNDPAVAIAWLLEQGVERVAYVDIDVHHGDGVERAFWDDPRVLTISIHESGRYLFPGTGDPTDIGGPQARGRAVNVALPPATRDEPWLRAFDAVVPPLLRAFGPQVLVSQQGCDSHVDDPLAHLAVTVDGQRSAYSQIHALAHELCEGRWVALGGGGYELVRVVPRTWTHLLAEATGEPLDPATETPQGWRDYVQQRTGERAPLRMTDGGETQGRRYDVLAGIPGDRVDDAIAATREAVFPCWGLDPWA